jgi:hypothetical protein
VTERPNARWNMDMKMAPNTKYKTS